MIGSIDMSKEANKTQRALSLSLEALELMYACYAHPEWISHNQQEEKILAQCVATTMTLRQALAKQEQGEPVGVAQWQKRHPLRTDGKWKNTNEHDAKWWRLGHAQGWEIRTLYTTPQQRTWVGLSVFEINDLVENTEYEDYSDLVERTEAKLKEKNNG